MPRGGARPGAGRPRKAVVAKVPKPRGGARPGAGRKPKRVDPSAEPAEAIAPCGTKKADAPEWPFGTAPEQPSQNDAPKDDPSDEGVVDPNLTPLEYMLQVMRGQRKADRDRMLAAQLAAPFIHAKKADTAKKADAADAAKKSSAGRFGSAVPPRLVSSR